MSSPAIKLHHTKTNGLPCNHITLGTKYPPEQPNVLPLQPNILPINQRSCLQPNSPFGNQIPPPAIKCLPSMKCPPRPPSHPLPQPNVPLCREKSSLKPNIFPPKPSVLPPHHNVLLKPNVPSACNHMPPPQQKVLPETKYIPNKT